MNIRPCRAYSSFRARRSSSPVRVESSFLVYTWVSLSGRIHRSPFFPTGQEDSVSSVDGAAGEVSSWETAVSREEEYGGLSVFPGEQEANRTAAETRQRLFIQYFFTGTPPLHFV